MLSMFFFASHILLGLQLARRQAYRFELLLCIHTRVHAHPAFPCMCTVYAYCPLKAGAQPRGTTKWLLSW